MRLFSSSATWPGASNGARCATPSRLTAVAVPPPEVMPVGDFLGHRRRGHGVQGAGDDLGGDADGAELVPHVEAGQGLAAEGVAEAVGVPEGVQEPAAELRLAAP